MKTVQDYIDLKAVAPNHRISYGQFGELYLPNTDKRHPTIILLHGGCWQAQHSLDKLGQLSKALVSFGFAVWNLEFRRLGNGGGFPETFEDVAQGTDYLNAIATKFSLNLTKITAMGHSAGGHLALWLAGRHHLATTSSLYSKSPLKLERVISLAGIPDLIQGVKQDICRGACQQLVGGLPDEVPRRYQIASPQQLLPFNIPHWHLVGKLDPIVPVKYLEPLIEKARQQDNNVHFTVIPDIGHFEMVMPDTPSWKYIQEALK